MTYNLQYLIVLVNLSLIPHFPFFFTFTVYFLSSHHCLCPYFAWALYVYASDRPRAVNTCRHLLCRRSVTAVLSWVTLPQHPMGNKPCGKNAVSQTPRIISNRQKIKPLHLTLTSNRNVIIKNLQPVNVKKNVST